MESVKLPAILPGSLDLEQINLQLRARVACLDWSAVVSAAPEHLAVLLAGLDASDDEEVLGSDTLSDTIGDRVIQVLERVARQTPEMHPKKPQKTAAAPQIWQQSPSSSLISPPSALLSPPSHFQMRAELEEMIFKDLLGPAGGEEEEVEESNVSDRYLVGLLAPKIRYQKGSSPNLEDEASSEDLPELQDELATTGKDNPEEGSTEGTAPSSNTMFPSSMGMTFCVDGEATEIEITAKWGSYERQKSEYLVDDKDNPKTVWKRYPIQGTKIQPLGLQKQFDWIVSPNDAPEVRVTGKIRKLDNGDWIVTLFLVNAQTEPGKLRDRAWLFQPELED